MKDYLKQFNTTAEYNTYINGTPDLPNVSLTLDDNEVHYNDFPDYSTHYLTLTALESGTFSFIIGTRVSTLSGVSYSLDNGQTWSAGLSSGTITTPTVNNGDKVLWKGIGNTCAGYVEAEYYTSHFSSTCNFNASGNPMSMTYGDDFINYETSDKRINALFYKCSKLVSAENLIIPSSFTTNITGSLDQYGYYGMFSGCTALTTAPALPATTLVQGCYSGLFNGCTALTTAPELPATTMANQCYSSMFQNCTSLTTAPELTATTLVDRCYYYMFKGCTSLTEAPELPATTLAYSCYGGMFSGCTSLTTAPELPATTLTSNCYDTMFLNCSSLTTAPELPATTLVSQCYKSMFSGCTNLNHIKMLATSGFNQSYVLYNWVNNVAATGTFVKAASATIPTGTSGIPENWTVIAER